jgi:hypothetical protein
VDLGGLQIRLEEGHLNKREVHRRLDGRYRMHPPIESVNQRLDNGIGPEKSCLIAHIGSQILKIP